MINSLMNLSGRLALVILAIHAGTALAQLIAPGQPIPQTTKPPVVFLNGYQADCSGPSFAGTFGIADQVLETNGQVSLFFDNCSVAGKPSIEMLGAAFGDFLSALHYDGGGAVDVVDVVVHSMGGLIVRSYLSGKQEQEGSFSPPTATRIRKAIFIATPHFGTGAAALGLGLNSQLDELTGGSHFVFDLATWNNGTDDLRGVDAIAVAGNGGSGRATMPGFDDGVVALSSASLGFYAPGRTRVVPFCHIPGGGLITLAGYCDANAKGIANMQSASDDTSRIIVSFLNDTTDWQTVGESAEQNSLLGTLGGFYVEPRTAADAHQKLTSATAQAAGGASKTLSMSNDEIAYTDVFTAGRLNLTAAAASGSLTRAVSLQAGSDQAFILKDGPNIARALPAAAAVFPLSVAPRMIIAIYGDALAQSIDQAHATPLPDTLSDAQALLGTSALGLFYASPRQINAVLPPTASGLVKLTVQNSAGSSSVNLMVEVAHPAIFTVDSSGTGPATALNARNGLLVTHDNPLLANDYMELFLTGLGATTRRADNLDHANQTPVVTIAGANCPVSFAGAAPGFVGLDQINCKVPSGLIPNPAAILTVKSGARTSNPATVAVQ